ncbi:MAG: 2-phosphosulfolactate phosphatase, partial [Verrucomicrobia bacterium]|nr:2-phosphosulfolactate phosphatase [Verrucomicrobiota bacterium]
MKTIEVLFTPAEFRALHGRDLRGTACVVFDVLRATSTIATALANGAAGVVPVSEVSEALVWRKRQLGVLLAGERGGMRIRGALANGGDFDLGNSPREFTREAVLGKTIVTTTTNGTRALRSCAGAKTILAGAFLNLAATAGFLRRLDAEHLLLVCSGTGEDEAFEDTLCAGALAVEFAAGGAGSPSAERAMKLWRQHGSDLAGAMQLSANAQR